MRLLWNWYGHPFARIQWCGVLSDNFNICNGVRQSGILSPFLFGVYIDELSLCLRSVNIGCRLSNMIVNHLLFADDAVIFAPSAKSLQQLLDICSKFALSHNVVFNVVKSQCLIVSSRSDFIRRSTFQLSGASLPYTECYKYLGHMINSALSDDQDIMKQTRSLYARANVIIRKFSHASLNTKLVIQSLLFSYI